MRRTTLSAFAAAALLSVATNAPAAGQTYNPFVTVDVPDLPKTAGKGKGKGANPGLLGWATFPAQSNAAGRLRGTAAKAAKKGKSSTYLRMGQPPAGTPATAAKKKPPPEFDYDDDDLPAGNKVKRRPNRMSR